MILQGETPPSLRLAAQASLELAKREQEERWRLNPWFWFQDRVMLLDPLAEIGNQVASFPNFPYLQQLVAEIHKESVIVIWKSRRMIASWTCLAYAVWMATMLKNQRIYCLSRKEGANDSEGSRELIWRTKWLIDNLRNGPRPIYEAGTLRVMFEETGSSITGMSSEPNTARGISANMVILDEMGFHEKPRETYAALKPTLEARGKFIGLSSSAEGFFREIVQDSIEEGGGAARGGIIAIPGEGVRLAGQTFNAVDESAPPEIGKRVEAKYQMIPGFAAWTNPINKFRVVAVHYTADPRKRSAEWKAREQVGVPLSLWLKEYELQFHVSDGRPVYLHEWRPAVMLVKGLKTEATRPILVGLDFGYHHPAMLATQLRYAQQFCILRALQGSQVRFEDFMSEVLVQLKSWFPTRNIDDPNDFLWCCDAAGEQEHGTGASEIKILRRVFGLRPKFKKVRIPPTIDIVRGYMSRTYRGEPCFLVDDNPTTSIIVDGLNGGYAYPQGETTEATTPVKDGHFDHTQDIIRYLTVNFGANPGRSLNRSIIDQIASADILERRTYAY